MYGDVEPQPLFYGRMKYMIIVPQEGAESLTDITFQIDASNYKKNTQIKFPRNLIVKSTKLDALFTLNFQESHFDQMVYNRSVFKIKYEGKLASSPIESTAFVEYYNMPQWLTHLVRPGVKMQYNKWMVEKNK
jgi:hypothetical protein